MNITKIVRTNALRMAWIVFASAPMTMLVHAARAGEPADSVPHKVVSFRDLNMNTPEGVAALYARIKSAAYEVCGNPERWDLGQRKLQICFDVAVSHAIAQVNNPMLTSLYNAKIGKPVITLAQSR